MNPKRLLFLGLAALALLCGGNGAFAQDDQDNQPHITPRKEEKEKRAPRPSPSPTPEAGQQGAGGENPDLAQPSEPMGAEQGESSSKDSQIDLNAGPRRGSAAGSVEDNAPKWDPHRAEKDIEVGNYYLKQRNYRAALERFHDALAYKPNDAEATYGLALTQEKMDLFSQAYNSYSKYLEILPHGPMAKESEEGMKRMEQRLTPETIKSSESQMVAEDISEGEKHLSHNDYDLARLSFEHAMRLAPDNPLLSFRLAQSLQGLQRPDAARMYYEKYLQLAPNGPLAADAKKNIGHINDVIGK